MATSAALTLVSLGAAEVRWGAPSADGDVPAGRVLLGPGKPLALLAYLASLPGHTASREHLLDLLWADLEPDDARHALRQTLWYLKRRVGESLTTAAGPNIELSRDLALASDRDRFLAAAEQRSFETAVDLYSGDFLPDLALPGGLEFEHWAEAERHRLRAIFVQCAEAVVRRRIDSGSAADALPLARRLRDLDALDERGWRILLESLIAARDSSTAVAEADALERLLKQEERSPEAATRALIRVVRNVEAHTDHSRGSAAFVGELVGREAEFSALTSAWKQVSAGAFRHLQITAHAGLGKTRLLEDLHARLRTRRARTIYIRATPGDRQIPCAFVGEFAASVGELPGAIGISPAAAATLVALTPRLSTVFRINPDGARGEDAVRARAAALHELLVAIADEVPIAILADDLHWADEDSMRIIVAALGRLRSERVLVVTAARPGHHAATMRDTAREITLRPLSSDHIAALLVGVAELPKEPWSAHLPDALHDATGGSPLLVLETLQHLIERRVLTHDRTRWRTGDEAALFAELSTGSALRARVASLDRPELSVMQALAIAGLPLETSVLAGALAVTSDALAPALEALERRGLISRSSTGWWPTHDELAAAALAVADKPSMQILASGVGRALMGLGSSQPSMLRRAGPVLAIAGDAMPLRQAFRAWVAMERRNGTSATPRQLARDFAGVDADESIVRALAAVYPITLRLRSYSWIGAPAAAGAMLLLLMAHRTPDRAPVPDARLVLRTREDVTERDFVANVRSAQIGQTRPIDAGPLSDGPNLPDLAFVDGATVSPDGTIWAASRVMPDSGGLDLVLVDHAGQVRRLTSARGDDLSPDWAPDGRAIVFATGRYNALEHNKLAIVDIRSGAVRQLTTGLDIDGNPIWSPLGGPIAFARHPANGAPMMLCWTAVDGTSRACHVLAIDGEFTIGGWYDERRVVVYARDDVHQRTALWLADVFSGEMKPLGSIGVGVVRLSHDGRWLACIYSDAGSQQGRVMVYPTDRVDEGSEVRVSHRGNAPESVQWLPVQMTPRYLDRLQIVPPDRAASVNAPTSLTLIGTSVTGVRLSLPLVHWSSDDSSIAVVDSTGTVHPRRTGTVTVHASVDGWRATTVPLAIGAVLSRAVLAEDWTTGLGGRFVAFGDPVPVVFDSGGVHTMWNRGDGSFESGVYSRQEFDARDGLGVEARVSLPITLDQWQRLFVELTAGVDAARLRSWDHRTGDLPEVASAEPDACTAALPAREGAGMRTTLLAHAGVLTAGARVAPAIISGAWHRVRVQLFPDGSCGIALDGRVVHWFPAHLNIRVPFRLVLAGASYRTRVLVGDVELWNGVRDDLDWRVATR